MQRVGRSLSITVFASVMCAMLGLAAPASGDTITLAWDPSPDSSVIGYVLYVNGPSGYSQSFDVGRSYGYTFTEAITGQQYCFAVAAYSATVTGSPTPQVCGMASTNGAPVLTAVANRSTVVGVSDSLQLEAYDPNGQPVTYAATGLPPGMTLQSSTGYISGTPTTVGTYPVTVLAMDGVLMTGRSFTWTIVVADNVAPSITIASPTAQSTYTTTSGTIDLAGSATDNVGVTQVTWVNSRGGSGTASGRTSWSVASIALVSGTNILTVTARDAAGNQSTDTLTVTSGVTTTTTTLAVTSLTADRTAPQAPGTTITFTANATGGTGPYQYKWWLFDGRDWYLAQQWTTSNRWTWTPLNANSAARVGVWVRNAGSTADIYDNPSANVSIPFAISSTSSVSSAPLTLTSISANRAAPQPVGTSIVFTASATGGTSPYQYKWWLFDGVNWIQRSDWSTSNSWTWTPNAANSAYTVGVWIRNAGSTVDTAGVVGTLSFAITATTASTAVLPTSGPLRVTGISPSRGAPSPAGVSVQFTAQISGGTAPQQYKWWLFDGATWYQMTGWSTSNTWTWAPPSANSQFQVGVWVRNAGSSADAPDSSDAVGSLAFPVY